ncbi:MAG: hypothetical protein ABF633_14690 [Clostridium sp.]|uniref:hypothetical protein n=1 Tax=Clostridium sp. TaxID=1506 RepID=UPI0039EAEA32
MIKAIHEPSNKVNEGYFIAKQIVKVNTLNFREKIQFKSVVEKSRRLQSMSYLICNCEVNSDNKKLLKLRTTLIKKNKNVNKENYYDLKKDCVYHNNKTFFRVITKNEVERFCDLSGDHNYIHKGDKPIVQAMLILLLLEDYLALINRYMYNCEITYIMPVIAGSDIFLYWQDSENLFGITDNKICFKLNFIG